MVSFVFFTTSLLTILLNFLKTVFNLLASRSSSNQLTNLLTNLLVSILSTSALKATKSFLAAKSDVSLPAACYSSFLNT